MAKPRKQFAFYYEFADGSNECVRAELKRRRGGPLPKVVDKARAPIPY